MKRNTVKQETFRFQFHDQYLSAYLSWQVKLIAFTWRVFCLLFRSFHLINSCGSWHIRTHNQQKWLLDVYAINNKRLISDLSITIETNQKLQSLSWFSFVIKHRPKMNGNTNNPVSYPTPEGINPFHNIISANGTNQQSMETNSFVQPPPTTTTTTPIPQPNPFYHPQPQPQNPAVENVSTPAYDENAEKWGTHVMGHPAVPTCHPGNKKAALWGAPSEEAQRLHYPYLQYSPVDKSNNNSGASQSILHVFNSWSNKAETMANNIWHNRRWSFPFNEMSTFVDNDIYWWRVVPVKTAPSVSGAAWAKVNLTAKAITGGGYEPLYKQTFATYPNEKLKKTFACYLSTSTGPVAGTLYLSNLHVAFCSDRPLSFTAPSGQQSWSYYKVFFITSA